MAEDELCGCGWIYRPQGRLGAIKSEGYVDPRFRRRTSQIFYGNRVQNFPCARLP